MRHNNNQSGFVLVTSLLMLVVLSGIAGALMSNSATDVKISQAFEERAQAENIALGANDEVFINASSSSIFASLRGAEYIDRSFDEQHSFSGTTAIANWDTARQGAVGCPTRRAEDATSGNIGIKCNRLRIRTATTFGKRDNKQVAVTSGAIQRLLKFGN
ncbi:hypothetical protein [Flocculibacter collagenilyticus]|uniref:hypothetical protein n=1 Tax=Flocculibacter collagenilyticus TaxID=2744479 RepID=UPI0018F65EC2|nr:hypothetical protein [Flocculibacter collagenilyticus]